MNSKTIVIIICTAILTAACISQFTCKHVPKPDIVPVNGIEREIKADFVDYKLRADSLAANEAKLKNENSTLKIKLIIAQGKVKTASVKVIETFSDHTSSDYITNVDSIKQLAVNDLIYAAYESDSICNENIINLNQQLENKDSALFVKDNFIISLKKNNLTLVDNQYKLEQYGKDMRRERTKRKLGGILWKGISGVLAGFLIYSSVK